MEVFPRMLSFLFKSLRSYPAFPFSHLCRTPKLPLRYFPENCDKGRWQMFFLVFPQRYTKAAKKLPRTAQVAHCASQTKCWAATFLQLPHWSFIKISRYDLNELLSVRLHMTTTVCTVWQHCNAAVTISGARDWKHQMHQHIWLVIIHANRLTCLRSQTREEDKCLTKLHLAGCWPLIWAHPVIETNASPAPTVPLTACFSLPLSGPFDLRWWRGGGRLWLTLLRAFVS